MKGRRGLGAALAVLVACAAPSGADELSSFSRAMAAYHDRRFDEALSYAKQAVRESPDHPDAHVLLGELYYLRQDLDGARKCWETALKLAPSRKDVREQLDRLIRESQVEDQLARNDTYPFVVRFSEGRAPVDLGSLRDLLRDTHRLVGQQFDYFPDYPITVIMYPEDDFEKVKSISHQVAGLYDGKIRLPLKKAPPGSSGYERLQTVLWHEYTHALVHDLAKGKCPLWLNEGIATLQQSRVEPIPAGEVRRILRDGKRLPWDELFEQEEYDETKLELYYVHSYLVAKYLVERWGWRELVSLLKRFGQGYPVADAFRAEFRTDIKTLEKEWESWLGRTY